MQSKRILLPALAITVALSLWVSLRPAPEDDVELARPKRAASTPAQPPAGNRKPAGNTAASNAPPPDNSNMPQEWQLRHEGANAAQVNLFASNTPAAPVLVDGVEAGKPAKPAKAPPPPPPPPPMAPPLPLQYLGRMLDGSVAQLFVSHNGDNLALKPGDTVAGSYRLDSIQTNRAVFTYMPLNQTQTMIFGEQP
jgi:hypothetical protein